MDRDTLYLDNDEEITSVVDKLKGATYASIDLVIPKDALLFQGVVNLKLLRKQAESLGKEITIVTQDKVGTKLAEQIGIPVVAKVGQTPKVVKMAEVEPVSFNEDDIEMKEEVAESSPKEDSGDAILDTSEVVSGAAAKEKVTDLPKEELMAGAKKSRGGRWKKIALVSGFVFIVLFVAAYIYIPLANVTVRIAAEKERVDISFKADLSYKEVDTGAETIPAKVITEEKEVTEKFQATGKKDVGEKAKGVVTLFNNYASVSVDLVSGDKLATSGGLVFVLNSNVKVPGYVDLGGGNKIPGKLEGVSVTASAVGDKYNLANNSNLVVSKFGSLFYASAESAFSGGSSKTVQFVTQADINKAKEAIGEGAEEELRSAIAQKIDDGQRLLEEAVKWEQISAEPSKKVNEEADEFELKAKYKARAITFNEDDLLRLAESVLSDKIGSTKEIVEKGSLISTTKFLEADFDKGTMSASLSGEAYIAKRLDEDKIKIDLTGEKEASARSYLEGIEGIEDVQVRYFPSFYKRMPRLKNHIYLKSEISKSDITIDNR
jgi:hypothetical protein